MGPRGSPEPAAVSESGNEHLTNQKVWLRVRASLEIPGPILARAPSLETVRAVSRIALVEDALDNFRRTSETGGRLARAMISIRRTGSFARIAG